MQGTLVQTIKESDTLSNSDGSLVHLQAQQLLLEFQTGLLRDASLRDVQRAQICTALAEADKNLIDGSDEFLQLLNVASIAQCAMSGAA